MDFRTIQQPFDMAGTITHNGKIMMLGSCFSDGIGALMQAEMFDVDVNPFGTTFNPISIARCLQRIIDCTLVSADELFMHEHRYHSFMHHSSFSGADVDSTLKTMNTRIKSAHDALPQLNALILTWGTSFVFTHNETNCVVNNCHKQPAAIFTRRRITVDEILAEYLPLIERLRAVNPSLKIIFTVSPVRHLADTLVGNNLSKATLLLAAEQLVQQRDCIYFPAYEAVIDDLRDYRFYANDMTHPSDVARQYVYELFKESFCDKQTQKAAIECRKLYVSRQHRFATNTPQAIIAQHETSLQKLTATLLQKYPYLKLGV